MSSRKAAQQKVAYSVFRVLRPIARMVLRYGLVWKDFVAIGEAAFVDVVSKDNGLRGRPANLAKTAAISGISRKRIRNARDRIEGGHLRAESTAGLFVRLLDVWVSNPAFHDDDGQPISLSLNGPGTSFADLRREVAADIPDKVLINELIRVGCAQLDASNRLEFMQPFYRSRDSADRLEQGLGVNVAFHAETVLNNISDEKQHVVRAEKVVFHKGFTLDEKAKFAAISAEKIDEFTQNISQTISEYQKWAYANSDKVRKETNDESENVAGVGVYYFER